MDERTRLLACLGAAKDIDRLRSLGWGERDIADAVAHGARMVSTNIIFNTFKIDQT